MAGFYPFGGSTPVAGKYLTTDGSGELSWDLPSATGSGGVTSVGTIDSQAKSANGLVIVGSTTIYAQTADASFPGLMSTGLQTFAGAKTFTGAMTLSATTGNTLVVDTNTLVVDATNNRVGVGTAAPVTSFHVALSAAALGLARLTNTSASGFSSWVAADSSDVSKMSVGYGNSGTASPYTSSPYLWYDDGLTFKIIRQSGASALVVADFLPTGNVAFDSNTLYVDAANNRVGVGTSAPGFPFEAYGSSTGGVAQLKNTNASGYSQLKFLDSSAVARMSLGWGNSSASAPWAGKNYIDLPSGQDLIIVVAGVTQFTLTGSTGAAAFVGAVTGSNLSGTNTGNVTLAAIGATPNANGASLSGQALNLQPASASFGGVVTTGAQTFAGAKTFNGAVGMVVPPVLTTGAAGIAGTATLVGGTVTVSTTAVATGDRIMVSRDTSGGTVGHLEAPTGSIVNATSFVINSSSGTDTSTVNWIITR